MEFEKVFSNVQSKSCACVTGDRCFYNHFRRLCHFNIAFSFRFVGVTLQLGSKIVSRFGDTGSVLCVSKRLFKFV
jgi:hypothetical protein